MKSTSTLIAALLFTGLQALTAADEAAKVTFADDVFPILDNKCVSCHNTDEAKGGLDLASFGATMAGGSGGAVVISENPKSSRLYTLAAHTEEPIMPPKGTKATDEELKIISDWIAGGLLETKNSKAKKKPTNPKSTSIPLPLRENPKGLRPCLSTSFWSPRS